ncbi:hypothetical protein ACIO7M_12690 [Streptomyces toxytricini]|uniref:Uncharacterized protein n=1 Tax=Streptomyces toxytricini TaxID=67369 RepID=A0ABW8EFE1_STRT5
MGTKLRWDLAVDDAEGQALLGLAEDCAATTVVCKPTPQAGAARHGCGAAPRRSGVSGEAGGCW